MGRRKNQSAGFEKSISPNMRMGKVEDIARLGDFVTHKELLNCLRNYFSYSGNLKRLLLPSDEATDGEEFLEQPKDELIHNIRSAARDSERALSVRMMDALRGRNADFFRTLAELMTIAEKDEAVSPVEAELIHLLRYRSPSGQKEIRKGCASDDLMRECAEDAIQAYEEMFPEWPPTIAELHAWVFPRVTCDPRTIRGAVVRLGFPVRLSKLGAPKKD